MMDMDIIERLEDDELYVDAVDDAVAEIKRLRELMEWRPIETAPQNGKWVLLWWPAVTDAPFVGYRVGNVWSAATAGDTWPELDGPTHFLPLPEPPQETK